MKCKEYWDEAHKALREGRIDEETFWAMLANMEIFCEDCKPTGEGYYD